MSARHHVAVKMGLHLYRHVSLLLFDCFAHQRELSSQQAIDVYRKFAVSPMEYQLNKHQDVDGRLPSRSLLRL